MSSATQILDITFDPTLYVLKGALKYPDYESVFVKDASGDIRITNTSLANAASYNPLNFGLALEKIQVAVSVIFKEIKQNTLFNENSQFKNAWKALGRSLVQLVPILGNGMLMLYDQVQTACCINPSIHRNLKDIEGPVVGIAFDGKTIFTIPVTVANARFPNPPNDILKAIVYIWAELKQKQVENVEQNNGYSTLKLADSFERSLNTPYAQQRTV